MGRRTRGNDSGTFGFSKCVRFFVATIRARLTPCLCYHFFSFSEPSLPPARNVAERLLNALENMHTRSSDAQRPRRPAVRVPLPPSSVAESAPASKGTKLPGKMQRMIQPYALGEGVEGSSIGGKGKGKGRPTAGLTKLLQKNRVEWEERLREAREEEELADDINNNKNKNKATHRETDKWGQAKGQGSSDRMDEGNTTSSKISSTGPSKDQAKSSAPKVDDKDASSLSRYTPSCYVLRTSADQLFH